MILDDSKFGVRELSIAINQLPTTPSIIRSLGVFKPEYLRTTYAEVEYQEGKISLVPTKERGMGGVPVAPKNRLVRTFKVPHLPIHDVIRADDVQNLRAFGTTSQLETVANVVNDKLADAKQQLEYTREHMALGALMGKILDADGSVLFDLNDEFKIERKEHVFNLSDNKADVGKLIDKVKTAQAKEAKGEPVTGYIVLASEAFMQAVIYHNSVKEPYMHYQASSQYKDKDNTHVEFNFKGVKFIQYDHLFESGETIADGEAIWLPAGTRNAFREFFAPADMNATVNTKALAYYASREKLEHDKGWSLHCQSNPLPMVCRPDMVATLKLG